MWENWGHFHEIAADSSITKQALRTHEANTTLFLNALCLIQLLKKENGAYRNTELSDTFLISRSMPFPKGYRPGI
ncbi:MAG: methyltransferase dimerization domain-containing protein [Desulfobacter sp.]